MWCVHPAERSALIWSAKSRAAARIAIIAALGADINVVAGQACAQACVLALVADCKRKLIIRNNNVAALLLLLVNRNGKNLSRSKRSGNVFCRILAVAHNVDFFSAEGVDNAVDALSSLTDAGADGVHIRVAGPNGDLGAGACLAGNRCRMWS